MADYNNPVLRSQTAAAGVMDAGLRSYMLRVYNYMLVGLALTGITSFGVYSLATTTDPSLAAAQLKNGVLLTSLGVTLFNSPLQWVVMLAPLGMVIFISARIQKLSAAGAQLSFWIFAGLMGISLSTIFMVYAAASIAQVFFIAAATFGAMSLWGYTTKADLTGFGSFLFMGLIGIVIASLVNLFFRSDMMGFVIAVIGVLVFTGLTAYDTQKIKEMYVANEDGTLTGRKAIMGALALYLDFINLFLMLLRLFGNRR